ncbi:hypothetical protein D3C83_172090 [compost metagenome]
MTRPSHSLVQTTSHSKWRLASAIRGGRTLVAANCVKPAFSSSFTPFANGRPRVTAFSSMSFSKDGRFTVNWPVAWTFFQVSL